MQTVKLNNGIEMPILGFGVYHNEEAVGKAIKNSGIDRKDIFLVTKVWVSNGGYEKAKASIDESLRKLQTDYIDLILIHQPFNDYYGTYRAMEEAYENGKTRAIGVSNFYPDRFVDLSHFCKIQPMINQVETHVFQQQKTAKEIMKKHNTQIMSWGPFAEGKNNYFHNETLTEIGQKYGKSVAQVALRFLTQEGVVVIPKSTHKNRMEENFDIFDFELAEDDLNKIRALDTGKSLFCDHYSPEFVEFIVNYKI